MGEDRVDGLPFLSNIFISGCYLQYTNILTLSDEESAIVNATIPVQALGKQEEVKTVQAKCICSSSPWFSLN